MYAVLEDDGLDPLVSGINESDDGPAANRPWHRRPSISQLRQKQRIVGYLSASIVALLLVGALALALVLLATGRLSGKGGTDDDLSHDASPSTLSDAFDDDGDTTYAQILHKTFAFTMYRDGYDVLSFFDYSRDEGDDATLGIIKYKFLDDYAAVVEPSASMRIEIDSYDDSFVYEYKVCSYDNYNYLIRNAHCAYGSWTVHDDTAVIIECQPHETYYIEVVEATADGVQKRVSAAKAICLYVRREIRALTERDVSTAMDSMYALWSTGEDDGRAEYGSAFHSSTYFTKVHAFNAAQQDADHIHEGQGFLAQHVKMTNMFEAAMQAVDRSSSLFYWDFTIDKQEELSLAESPMFSPDTFGSLTSPQDSYWGWTYSNDSMDAAGIPDGRWKGALADVDDEDDFPVLRNSFGFLRGPWNYNPSPYITRFAIPAKSKMPSCSSYYTWLKMDSLSEFNSNAPFDPHATTHGMIGAQFGCDKMVPLYEQGAFSTLDDMMSQCLFWNFHMKEWYRSGLIERADEDDCSVDSTTYEGISCGVKCPDDEDAKTALLAYIKKIVMLSNVPKSFKDWSIFYDFLCDGDAWRIFAGDHLEAASPADPSFWPIHPNQERLLQLKLMTGGFDDGSWPTDIASVCDKSNCYEGTYGLSADYNDRGNFTECCIGHYEDDRLLDFETGDLYSGAGLTNREVYTYTDPRSAAYNMTYIYDDFSWDHCADTKDFSALIVELYDKYWNDDDS